MSFVQIPSSTRNRYAALIQAIHDNNTATIIAILRAGIFCDDLKYDDQGRQYATSLMMKMDDYSRHWSGHPFTEGEILADCLAIAVFHGLGHLWPHFMEAGADFSDENVRKHVVDTALFEDKDLETLKAMTEAGIVSPRLKQAVVANSAPGVRWLLSRGAALNEADPKTGRLPLHDAIQLHFQDFHAWKTLVEAGADIHARDNHGLTSLHLFARDWRVESIRDLLRRGAHVSPKSDQGMTPLLETCRAFGFNWNHLSGYLCLKVLLHAGANPLDVNSSGNSGLHLAVGSGPAGIVRFLIKNGFDPHALNCLGKTPLDRALLGNNGDAFTELERFSPFSTDDLIINANWEEIPKPDHRYLSTPVLTQLIRSADFWEEFVKNTHLPKRHNLALLSNPTVPQEIKESVYKTNL